MTQPSPRERIESLWDRATPIGPLLDAYRDDIAIDMGRDLLRDGLKAFLLRLIGEKNTEMVLEAVRSAVLRNDAYRAAVLGEAIEAVLGRVEAYEGMGQDAVDRNRERSAIVGMLRRMADGSQS